MIESTELDANKTALTHHLTGTAWGYLAGAGFKPIETEVAISSEWIADLASFVYPTMTEMRNMKLNKRFRGDGGDNWYSYFLFNFGFPLTAIVEVKASRSDFQRDIKRKFSDDYPAHLCYLAYPCDMLADDEVPDGWIGLKCTKDGQKVSRVLVKHGRYVNWDFARIHPQNPGAVANFIAQVAIRRHHRTHYAEMRAMLKERRAREKGYSAEMRPGRIIQAIAGYLSGKERWRGRADRNTNLRGAFEAYGIKVPEYVDKEIEFLEGLKKEAGGNES